MFDKHDSVGTREVEPEPPDVRREQQHVDRWVAVEALLDLESVVYSGSAGSMRPRPGLVRLYRLPVGVTRRVCVCVCV